VLRLVLDEAHQILSDYEFRPQFLKLRELADFKVQLIYLTASLPKRLEAQFLTQLCLPPDTPIIRAPSDQPQISYIKLTYNTMNTNVIRFAIDVAQIMTEVIGPNQKGIIFCSTIDEADELGAKFTHKCVSHSKLPFEVKAHNQDAWKAGHAQWIAATTGMVCGIDDPHVGAVIFVGVSYGLVNIYQGAGRSGRDGTPSWAIVLQAQNTSRAIPQGGLKDDPQCLQESEDWLRSEQCRRLGCSNLFDSARVSCFDLPNAHFCDYCDPSLEILPQLRSKIIDLLVVREDEFDVLDSHLMDMDFEGIMELSHPQSTPLSLPCTAEFPTYSSTLSHPPAASSSTQEDLFRFAPTPCAPSMQILSL